MPSNIRMSLNDVLLAGLVFSLCVPLSTAINYSWLRVYFFDFWLVALLVVNILRKGERKSWSLQRVVGRKRDEIGKALLILVVWFFVVDLFALDRGVAFERLGLWFRGLLIYQIVYRTVGRSASANWLVSVVCVVFIVEGVVCLLQLATASDIGAINRYFGETGAMVRTFATDSGEYLRVQGTFFNTGIIAEWSCLLVALMICDYMMSRPGIRKGILLMGWLSALFCALFTYYRSAWSATAMAVAGSMLAIRGWGVRRSIRAAAIRHTVAILLLIGCAGFGVLLVGEVRILRAAVERGTALEGRFEKKWALIVYSAKIMGENWLSGVGQGNFYEYLSGTDYLYYFYTHEGGAVHNIPALVGAEAGIVGFVVFGFFLVKIVVKGARMVNRKDLDRRGVLVSAAWVGVVVMVWEMQWSLMFIHHSVLPVFFVVLGLCHEEGSFIDHC